MDIATPLGNIKYMIFCRLKSVKSEGFIKEMDTLFQIEAVWIFFEIHKNNLRLTVEHQ